jgi:hypothetical protein
MIQTNQLIREKRENREGHQGVGRRWPLTRWVRPGGQEIAHNPLITFAFIGVLRGLTDKA